MFGRTVKLIEVNGKITFYMVKEYFTGLMELIIKGNIKMMRDLAQEL
jgi:hypothetical protein